MTTFDNKNQNILVIPSYCVWKKITSSESELFAHFGDGGGDRLKYFLFVSGTRRRSISSGISKLVFLLPLFNCFVFFRIPGVLGAGLVLPEVMYRVTMTAMTVEDMMARYVGDTLARMAGKYFWVVQTLTYNFWSSKIRASIFKKRRRRRFCASSPSDFFFLSISRRVVSSVSAGDVEIMTFLLSVTHHYLHATNPIMKVGIDWYSHICYAPSRIHFTHCSLHKVDSWRLSF